MPIYTHIGGYTYLLDAYPTGATVGCSMYKLRSTYTGACVRIRRKSDNAETDIGFSGNIIDINSIVSFAGVNGTAYVTIWYNQVAGGVNLSQTTASLQGYIYNTSFYIQNGVPTIYLGVGGSNGYYNVGTANSTAPNLSNNSLISLVGNSIADLLSLNASAGLISYNSSASNNPEARWGMLANGKALYVYWNGAYAISNTDVQYDIYSIHNSFFTTSSGTTTLSHYRNDTLKASGTRATLNWYAGSPATFEIGAYKAVNQYKSGYLAEFILWNSDQSANRAAILQNQNNRFHAY